MNIPLSKVYIDEEMKKAVLEALESGWYILGERVREFERRFAEFCGVKHAVAVSSGTAAIFLTLLAYDIKRGDEVLVPSFSFIATASPVLFLQAKPIFVDIDPRTYTIDPRKIKKKISERTRAIIPVHLYGHPADMDPIMEVAEENGLIVVEDACQAHGAEYKGQRIGGIGHAACFSFYPSKCMTVCGDGGMVTTNDEEIAKRIRMLRNHGRTKKYVHEMIGYNLRFNEIQAAIGIKQLEKLPSFIERRRKIAEIYNRHLEGVVTTPVEEEWARHVYYVYVIRTKERDNLQKYLKSKGISTGIHYPVPIHKQPAILRSLGTQPALENTERCASEVLSLPMFPELSQNEVEYICDHIHRFFR